MAGRAERLKLSDLKPNMDYPLENSIPEGRCLIHVKLTDFCARSVENLIHSDKGAFFSLWFEDNGGTMTIPVNAGQMRKFQFKTAHLQGREAQSSLECVHQNLDQYGQNKLCCWGPMEHRVTVQGTEEVYETTRTKMKQAERQRKEPRAQEIKLPSKAQSKAKKILQASEFAGQTTRKPSRPKPLSSSAKAASKSHSIKDRVIHLLALKPLRRSDLVTRLKKETKRSETSLTNLESILNEVSDNNQGTCKLKANYYANLQIESWPFYSEAERQLLKRRHTQANVTTDSALPLKRPFNSTDEDVPSKRAKLIPTPPPPAVIPTTQHADAVKPTPLEQLTPIVQVKNPTVLSQSVPLALPVTLPSNVNPAPPATSNDVKVSKKKKEKKKKKQKIKENHNSRSNASSTSHTADYSSQFPPITSNQQRTNYKQLFSSEYPEYLALKENIEKVSLQYQSECTALSQRLQSLDRNSEEARKVKSEIRARYNELQENRQFIDGKRRFEELHHKLEHIKRMVIHYDNQS